MKVADVMSRDIVTVTLDTPYRDLWKAIFKKHVNAMPVVDREKKLLGIITREDLLEPIYPQYQEVMENLTTARDFEGMEERLHDLVTLKARDVMCKRVIFTRDTTPIMRALSRMIVRRVNQIPVLTESDRLVGMVTKGDVFYSLFRRHFAKSKLSHHKQMVAMIKTAKKKKKT